MVKKSNLTSREIARKKEKDYMKKMQTEQYKQVYLKNMINGKYHLARYNMIVEQINKEKIEEILDSKPKTMELMVAELSLNKMRAINSFREAYFAKEEAVKKLGITEEELNDYVEDYRKGKIIRENYDEGVGNLKKAKFVDE